MNTLKRYWNNLKATPYRCAYRLFVASLKRDPELASVWRDNIAMPIFDGAKGKLNSWEANRIADALMLHLFEVRQKGR